MELNQTSNTNRSLGDLLFRENYCPKIRSLWMKEQLSITEAKQILNSMQHPEVRSIIYLLQQQIDLGVSEGHYPRHTKQKDWDYYLDTHDNRKTILLTNGPYASELLHCFCRVLESAYPQYHTKVVERGLVFKFKDKMH